MARAKQGNVSNSAESDRVRGKRRSNTVKCLAALFYRAGKLPEYNRQSTHKLLFFLTFLYTKTDVAVHRQDSRVALASQRSAFAAIRLKQRHDAPRIILQVTDPRLA